MDPLYDPTGQNYYGNQRMPAYMPGSPRGNPPGMGTYPRPPMAPNYSQLNPSMMRPPYNGLPGTSPNRSMPPQQHAQLQQQGYYMSQHLMGQYPHSAPSLTPNGSEEIDASFPALGRPPALPQPPQSYVNVMATKKPKTKEEFSIVNDEFPALPGAKPPSKPFSPEPTAPQNFGVTTSTPSSSFAPNNVDEFKGSFGLMGLLSVIRASDPDVNLLSVGSDLSLLGLNLTAASLYPSFLSPWADAKKEPQYELPACYTMRSPLPVTPQRFSQMSDETLFYMFYNHPAEVLQQLAAQLLYVRDWRYHKELKMWLTRVPGYEAIIVQQSFEKRLFQFFDFNSWKQVQKEFGLHYEHLEKLTMPERKPTAPHGTSQAPSLPAGPMPPMGLLSSSSLPSSTS